MLYEPPQMIMIQRVEKLADVHFQHPPAIGVHRFLPQSLQRLMRAPTGPEPVRAMDKVLLVDGFEQHHHRALQDFILQRRDADRSRLGWRACFGNVNPFDRRCPVAA